MNKAYEQYRKEELQATKEAWSKYRESGMGIRDLGKAIHHSPFTIHHSPFTISIAAAILILAMGTGIWLKREKIFGPSERQLTENYEQTVKALSLYSQSLTKSFDRLKTLKLGDDPE